MKLGELLDRFFSWGVTTAAYIIDGEVIKSESTTLRDLFYESDIAFVAAGAYKYEHYIKPEWLEREVTGFYAFEKDKIIVEVGDNA